MGPRADTSNVVSGRNIRSGEENRTPEGSTLRRLLAFRHPSRSIRLGVNRFPSSLPAFQPSSLPAALAAQRTWQEIGGASSHCVAPMSAPSGQKLATDHGKRRRVKLDGNQRNGLVRASGVAGPRCRCSGANPGTWMVVQSSAGFGGREPSPGHLKATDTSALPQKRRSLGRLPRRVCLLCVSTASLSRILISHQSGDSEQPSRRTGLQKHATIDSEVPTATAANFRNQWPHFPVAL